MNGRHLTTVGVAITTAVVVGGLLTELLAARIAFSAIVGLPAGLLAGVVAGTAAWVRYGRAGRLRPALFGVAAFGYALLAAASLSYSVPPVRGLVSVGTAVPFAVACAVLVGVAAALRARRAASQRE
ncbi:hypothetical protein [Halorubrum sp. PV6]|uniref:hypothetical protein n=1 Tax=Halorubrum sp. PV6 TaxID=634157 RepID=UPI000F85AF6E|nr:hypothetical protein [Halorubrum sp. PV6]AZQ14559.1 hypothetical protein DOS48_06795 [Halorubrum sp. PV6]